MAKRKINNINFTDKYAAILRIESGEDISKIAKELNVGRSTIYGWTKNKYKILESISGMVTMYKRSKASIFKDMEDEIYNWFTSLRENNKPISG